MTNYGLPRPRPKHHKRRLKIPFGAVRFLAVLEGFEGGFAIGASVITALSFTGLDRRLLIATALISIIVNGFMPQLSNTVRNIIWTKSTAVKSVVLLKLTLFQQSSSLLLTFRLAS